MKAIFKENNNTALALSIAGGAITAGAAAYLFFTKSGASFRANLFHKLKDEAKNKATGIVSDKTGIGKKTVKKVADHVIK